ncbi:uncharacterized protein LOC128277542 [Anopheles cruzii]|uniref:uncharacterized protein LOC128277542 n=1 Tax=Anopheles cruzii TaxID=68878 RepID=UPI0022EC5D36|nr:uncharacterized protein LOC128277542 [Anopheles cruzii]
MVLPRGTRGGYHSRGASSRGGIRSSYHSGSYHGSNHNSNYDNRNDSRNNRYSGGGGGRGGSGGSGGGYDSRNSSRYDGDSRYSRHDNRNDSYKRTNTSKYEDNRDRRSPDRKRPRNDHTSQGGGSSRRDYGSGSSGGRGGSSSSRYHDSGSSYDKRGSSNDHHSTSSGGGGGGVGGNDTGSSRNKFDHHHRSSSSNRSHGGMGGDSGSSYRSRDNNNTSSMGPPRSVIMRSSSNNGSRSMMRPPMSGSRPLIGGGGSLSGMHRRGTTMRGRISNYRSDGRRGMLNTRMLHHRRPDMRPPLSLHNRRYPSIRGRGELRSRISSSGIGTKRPMDNVSRKTLIKRALQAAKDLDDDRLSDNEDDDDVEDEDAVDDEEDEDLEDEPTPKKPKKASLPRSIKEEEDKSDQTRPDHDDDLLPDVKKKEIKKEEKDADSSIGTAAGDEDDSKKQAVAKAVVKKKISTGSEKSSDDRKSVVDDDGEKRPSTKITTKYRSSSFIKLTCTHCNMKCVTFKEYQAHLYGRQHKLKMRQLSQKCRERLLEMRAAQRNAQKDVDEKSEDGADGEDGKSQRAAFCMLCRLNYRQPRATHQQSEGHKEMKKFLMPYCSVCKIGFKSPMAYEMHRASLDHLKIKARVERYASTTKDDSGDETPLDLGELVDLENLTTVDEVGKVDELCDAGTKDDGSGSASKKHRRDIDTLLGTDEEDDDEDDEDDDDELQMIIGEEHVKKVEVQYCELCNIYLPRRIESQDKALRDHCKKRSHLKLYIRFRNDKKLREQAERIHKKKLKGDKEAASAKKDDEKKSTDVNSDSAKATTSSAGTVASAATEKKPVVTETTAKDTSTASGGSAANTTVSHSSSNVTLAEVKNADVKASTSETAGLVNVESGLLPEDANDDQLWQVDDELGDLLRGVNEVDEEDDEKEAMLDRYDKFRHTEKNGLEKDDDGNAADSKTGVKSAASATNGAAVGGGDAANGDPIKESIKVEV